MRKKYNIAFLVDAWFPFVGGGQIYARELKSQLEANWNCTITIFAPPHHNILVRALWTFFLPIRVWFHNRNNQFDVIHSQGFHSGLSGKISKLLTHVPLVHTAHGSHLMDQQSISLKAKIETWLLTGISYDALISVTQHLKKKVNKSKFIYVPNGVNSNAFKQFNEVEKNIDILWVGRDDPQKGYDIWGKAKSRIKKEYPQITIVDLLGKRLSQNDLFSYYARSKIFVISSRSEGFPLSLLEAWAGGAAVVSTDVGEIPNIITQDQTGLLARKNDYRDIANKVKRLLSNESLRKKIATLSKQHVASNYSWKRVAQETFAVYKQVIIEN